MKKSETEDYNELGFDPYVDFSQFLKEARSHHHSRQVKTEPPLGSPSLLAEQKILGEDQRNKSNKSWKSSLFSWWKMNKNKKSKSQMGPSSTTTPLHIPNTRRESVSGPIYGGGEGKAGFTQRAKRPTSGPLTGIFTPLRRGGEEVWVPYVNLDQLNHPIGQQAYGPVYLVT